MYMIQKYHGTGAHAITEVLVKYRKCVEKLEELQARGKTCVGIDLTKEAPDGEGIVFVGANTYGKADVQRPEFVLRVRDLLGKNKSAKSSDFDCVKYVREALRVLEPIEPRREVTFLYKCAGEEVWHVKFDGPFDNCNPCLLYTSPSPRDATLSRMPSSA